MKKSDNTRRGKRNLTPSTRDADRRRFLKVMGGGAAVAGGAAAFDAAFIAQAFGAATAVSELKLSPGAVQHAISSSNHPEHFAQIERSLAGVGLVKRVEESVKTYRATTRDGKQKVVTIVPYHPANKSVHIVGAIGAGEGSPPSGVSVTMDGTKLVSITTHDVLFGKLVTKTLTPGDLQSKGPQAFVERDLKRDMDVHGDLTVETAAQLSAQSFSTFLNQEQAQGIYTPAQVRGFLLNTPSVRMIAQMQYARHRGLAMSPGNACCCCSTTCWGCCSCSCAVTSSYLSPKYKSRMGHKHYAALRA